MNIEANFVPPCPIFCVVLGSGATIAGLLVDCRLVLSMRRGLKPQLDHENDRLKFCSLHDSARGRVIATLASEACVCSPGA